MIDLKNLTIEKAHKSLKNGDFTAVELVEAYLEVIKTNNKNLNIFLEVFADAIEQARVADEEFKSGTPHLMTGIPIAIKDNILFEGHKVSAGSKILENYTATYNTLFSEKGEHTLLTIGEIKDLQGVLLKRDSVATKLVVR